jgi:hypothetical protein
MDGAGATGYPVGANAGAGGDILIAGVAIAAFGTLSFVDSAK